MKSPITGKEMTLVKEPRSMDFRKETFEVVFHYYKCEDSEEQFATTSLDEVNMNQLYNQYHDRSKIRENWRDSMEKSTTREISQE